MFFEYLMYWKKELSILLKCNIDNKNISTALKNISSYIRTLNYFEERDLNIPEWLGVELEEFLQKLNNNFYFNCRKWSN